MTSYVLLKKRGGCNMAKHENLVGNKYGQLTVIKEVGFTTHLVTRQMQWECLCDCGGTKITTSAALKTNHTRSCGCLHAKTCTEKAKTLNYRHGKSNSSAYRTWSQMVGRCKNNRDPLYGGRGITFCDEWSVFENFYADMGDPPIGMSMDRIDVDGNYCKENCRWADYSLQAFNKRKHPKNTSTKTGVKLDKRSGKWGANIGKGGKRIWLGTFTSFEDAVKAREEAELKYFGFIKE